MDYESKFCSSLTKVMPNVEPSVETKKGTALRGERFSFQLAYRYNDGWKRRVEVKVESDFGKHLRMRQVDLVPVEFTGTEFDDDIISKEPGLYPDVLNEMENGNWAPALPYWRSVWFTVDVPKTWKPGTYEIKVSLAAFSVHDKDKVKTELGSKTFKLKVLDAVLPAQKLKNTHWFHSDCLATYYKVPVFSDEYWRIVGNFMKSAVNHGINMILTPVFTPPLDTEVGKERPTVQLVGVTVNRGKYSFDFSNLEKWVKLAQSCGVKYFEISHLFSQWGAYCAPKVVATVNGKEKRIFGWDTKAVSDEYRGFLDAFLPELVSFLKEHKLQKKTYFHCSDEPVEEHLESYKADKAILDKHLKGFKIMDALSHVQFYKDGLVNTPVPSETHLEEFIAAGMKERWTYYCCGPTTVYSNRFLHMPSSRNRIFGTLLWVHGVEGFLHWGFNFYYSGLSRHQIDPYACNDAEFSFPDGDGFLPYPGKDGNAVDSIRYEVFNEALQDQRVLELLETKVDREKIQKALDKLSPTKRMKIDEYPKGEEAVLAVREKINSMLEKALKAEA